jgi:hypothetical protein
VPVDLAFKADRFADHFRQFLDRLIFAYAGVDQKALIISTEEPEERLFANSSGPR